jgi:hypothetical protein
VKPATAHSRNFVRLQKGRGAAQTEDVPKHSLGRTTTQGPRIFFHDSKIRSRIRNWIGKEKREGRAQYVLRQVNQMLVIMKSCRSTSKKPVGLKGEQLSGEKREGDSHNQGLADVTVEMGSRKSRGRVEKWLPQLTSKTTPKNHEINPEFEREKRQGARGSGEGRAKHVFLALPC